MNFICDRGLLLDACGDAAKFVPQKTPIAALEGFLLEIKNINGEGNAKIIGFDTESGIEINIPCTVITEGSLVVNAKTFTEIVKNIDEPEISVIETSPLNLSISGGSTNFTLRCTESNLFPSLPSIKQIFLPSYVGRNIFIFTQPLRRRFPYVQKNDCRGYCCCRNCNRPFGLLFKKG